MSDDVSRAERRAQKADPRRAFEMRVYMAIADGERSFLTKREMYDSLVGIAESMRPNGGFAR